jgi:UDP:flavonoid glycosyltransferase YjiC (YdhE family)
VDFLGVKPAEFFYPLAAPLAFRSFAAPVNALRRDFGLPAIGGLLDVLTHGDFTLYPDPPELCPTRALPASHHYLGAVPWAPAAPIAPNVAQLIEGSEPYAYVTLGSSGRASALGAIVEGLSRAGLRSLVATAGRLPASEIARLPASGCVTDFVPGDRAARAARLVVTNGGSSSGYQALAEGKAVLGVPSNLDQYLASAAIERAGAGLSLRAGALSAQDVAAGARRLMSDATFERRALDLAVVFARTDCHQRSIPAQHH